MYITYQKKILFSSSFLRKKMKKIIFILINLIIILIYDVELLVLFIDGNNTININTNINNITNMRIYKIMPTYLYVPKPTPLRIKCNETVKCGNDICNKKSTCDLGYCTKFVGISKPGQSCSVVGCKAGLSCYEKDNFYLCNNYCN